LILAITVVIDMRWSTLGNNNVSPFLKSGHHRAALSLFCGVIPVLLTLFLSVLPTPLRGYYFAVIR
jgi:hypothetical protein